MSSGDSLFSFYPENNNPPDASFATPDWILRTSTDTPDEYVPVLDFDPAANEFAIFRGVLPEHYSGGGITLKIGWMSESAAAEVVRWEAAFNSFTDGVDNVLSKTAAAVQSVNDTANGTARNLNVATITFTNGAQIDNLAAGEMFLLRVNRDAIDAADTMNSNDAELLYVYAIET